MAAKTVEEIEKLKASWQHDPCWDIENTYGFEDHKEELMAYRMQVQAESDERIRKGMEQRALKMKEETGITDPIAAQYLYTFAEIEVALHRSDGEMELDQAGVAQARAMLLLAAQVKRVADELRYMRENQDSELERQEQLDLYRRGL